MASNETPGQGEAQQSLFTQLAIVIGAVALCFRTAVLKLGLVFAPVFAVLAEASLTQVGLGGSNIPEPLGATLADIRAWILGFSLLWWMLVGLWWLSHYPMDPEHHDFEWYVAHCGLAIFGLYAWAFIPAVVSLLPSAFSVLAAGSP